VVEIRRLLTDEELRVALARDVAAGLARRPRAIRSRWLWDERGSELFEAICALPDYPLPRRERLLLDRHVSEIVRLAKPDTVVELGPGGSDKTDALLSAALAVGLRPRYVAVDVSEPALRSGLERLAERFDVIEIAGVVADFERQLGEVPVSGRVLVTCLGSTLGALEDAERADLLAAVARVIGESGALLLGLDLVKPPEQIVAAYTDAAGLSAALIANLLPVLNRELGADFDPARFESEASWNPACERMEMAVRSRTRQTVTIAALGTELELEPGATLRTEVSTKFRPDGIAAELAAAGLAPQRWWARGGVALALATPRLRGAS
jgi:L-histidine N-alpha-methyltransferase